MDVLNSNELRAAIPQAPQRFDLRCVGAQQSCRGRRNGSETAIGAVPTANSPKHGHGCGVGAGHLDNEGTFHLVLGLCALNQRQAGVHGNLGNSVTRQFGGFY
jgi:hypothetical protein